MTKDKLLELFKKEKARVKTQIFDPIISAINDPKYEEFYNYFLLCNINFLIMKNGIKVSPIPFTTNNNYIITQYAAKTEYKWYFKEVNKKILEIYNFEIFKLVFGEKDYQIWALTFFKYILYLYFEKLGLANVKQNMLNDTFNPINLINEGGLDIIRDTCFKILYGYSETSISKLEYWQKTTGISKKKYLSFSKIVNSINPAIYLLNSFLYYTSSFKYSAYETKVPHKYKNFSPFNRVILKDKNIATEWILNYMAVLILNCKMQTVLWKAIQNLTFGTEVKNKTIALRTIAQITINIQDVYKLDKKSLEFFKNLKNQTIFLQKKVPESFDLFIAQDPTELNKVVSKYYSVFENLIKKTQEQK